MYVGNTAGNTLPAGYAARYRSLAAFLVSLVFSQTFWFNFAPLLPMLSSRYGVSELSASYTILVFSLSNILLSSVAGSVIDRRGFRYSVLLGLAVMSIFACLRIFSTSFWILLATQAGISAAVPFIMVAIPRAIAELFPSKSAPRIGGFCSVAICVGSSSSLWLSPRIILGMGFQPAMILFAGMVLLSAVAFAVLVPKFQEPVSNSEPHTNRLLFLLSSTFSGFVHSPCSSQLVSLGTEFSPASRRG